MPKQAPVDFRKPLVLLDFAGPATTTQPRPLIFVKKPCDALFARMRDLDLAVLELDMLHPYLFERLASLIAFERCCRVLLTVRTRRIRKAATTHYHLINEDAEGPPVHCSSMALGKNDLWSNVFCNVGIRDPKGSRTRPRLTHPPFQRTSLSGNLQYMMC